MKKRLPTILTALLLIGALVFLTQRERWSSVKEHFAAPGAAAPEDTIWRMSDAARAGDVKTYLDCFSGALRQNLQKAANEMGEAQFGEYLKKRHGETTGIALSDLQQPDAQTARLRVEFVLQGKNEAQQHHFKLIDGVWKIESIDNAEQIKVLIPYGTEAAGKE